LDNDFEFSEPPDCILEATAKLIATNYLTVPLERVLGHCEITGKPMPFHFFLKHSGPVWLEAATAREIEPYSQRIQTISPMNS